jgi:hypothetical protein
LLGVAMLARDVVDDVNDVCVGVGVGVDVDVDVDVDDGHDADNDVVDDNIGDISIR